MFVLKMYIIVRLFAIRSRFRRESDCLSSTIVGVVTLPYCWPFDRL